jgi:hypothetical protein
LAIISLWEKFLKNNWQITILPHLKIYLSADSLPHEKNYLKRWTMTSSTPGATLGERGVEDGAKHGDKERVE